MLEELVAASLLRIGTDTRAAACFKDRQLALWPASHPLELLAGVIEPRQTERASAIARARALAAPALARARAAGITPIPITDEAYPPLLKEIPDPPIVIWVRGQVENLSRPSVAIVGSRKASPAGRAMAGQLARDLARAGLAVVSGLARGIDGAAHKGALEAAGTTFAIVGNGADVVYPREHAALMEQVAAAGCVASELPPGTLPLPRHFPLRNRLISGLSLGVVVVEAAERSGSLITARMALEQGRDVLAVPGNVVSGCHKGCHALIKDGARLVETAEDVLQEIGWIAKKRPRQGPPPPPEAGTIVAAMVRGEPVGIDDLAVKTGRSAPGLLAELGALELEGRVGRTTGGMFVRLD